MSMGRDCPGLRPESVAVRHKDGPTKVITKDFYILYIEGEGNDTYTMSASNIAVTDPVKALILIRAMSNFMMALSQAGLDVRDNT